MKLCISNSEKAHKWIEVFKIIKNLNTYTTICSRCDDLLIQIMDDSHVCLLNIDINKQWFDSYESSDETFSFMSSIMVKLLHLYVPNTLITFETLNDRLVITFEYEDHSEKIFELNLIDIDKDLLEPQQIEGSLEFKISTKTFDKYISELLLFGDSSELFCYKDNLYFKSSGDEGKITLKLPHDILNELQVEEDLHLKTNVSLKYLSYLTKSNSVFKHLSVHIQKDVPIYLQVIEEHFKMSYYVAPKISDDEEEESNPMEEFEHLENKVI